MTTSVSLVLWNVLFLTLLLYGSPFYHHGFSRRSTHPYQSSSSFVRAPRTFSHFVAPATETTMTDERILTQVQSIYQYAKNQTVSSIIDKDEIIQIIKEMRSNDVFLLKCKNQYDFLFNYVMNTLQTEDRTFEELIGPQNVVKILDSMDRFDLAKANTTLTVLFANPVFTNMLNNILYEAIFGFLQYLDVIGSIIQNIPMFGPLRNLIVTELKRYLDTTAVGNQIKKFLLSFNAIALRHMIDFLLASNNQQAVKNAIKNVLQRLLFTQPVNTLVKLVNKPDNTITPDQDIQAQEQDHWLRGVQVQVWSLLTTASLQDLEKTLALLYTHFGHIPLNKGLVVELEDVFEASPTTKTCLLRSIQAFYASEEGKCFQEQCNHNKEGIEGVKE